jgi:uncharacterized protein (DUF1697 family)
MNHYVALLRGINVGGKNLIKMSDLKTSFETMNLSHVTTYIQSGNVLFASDDMDQKELSARIEHFLTKSFNYSSRVVVRSAHEMKKIVNAAPKGFGEAPSRYRYDVIFLRESVSAADAMKSVPLKEGVDQAFAGKGVLYFSRLISKASQSHLARIVTRPVYQEMTIRNWNTTTKLLKLLEEKL